MAQNIRQSRLFAAEDYKVVYESYVNANLQAFDYDTIREAMVNYVRNNYPENYNDWIESAEFVALLDVVAQFGHNLAYRVDLNSRNNFLSTAERQESVFKLAEFLGYTPRRNVPAFGDMKIISVKTNEDVIGSEGESLGGQDIRFEITNTNDNIDDFIAVMNSIFETSNSFGNPRKQAIINGISTEFYNVNSLEDQIKFSLDGIVLGQTVPFNVVSSDYDNTTRTVIEKTPNRSNSFGLFYKNDNKGINSNNTGFFVSFKQGDLQFRDFEVNEVISEQSFDVDTQNINQTDVWVQNVNGNDVEKDWTQVKDTNGNVAYNNLAGGIRDIYSVKTRTNNQITVKFADKAFGNIPKDTIRVWFRTSLNANYVLRPDDFTNKKVSINYRGIDGNIYTAVLTLQLKENVVNANSSETVDSIKQNAPKNYASQNRMITAQDYNSIEKNQLGNVLKVKAINRTFSGHSRYSKFNDPTGEYKDLTLYTTDNKIYSIEQISTNVTNRSESSEQVFDRYVKNILQNDNFVNFYYSVFRNIFNNSLPASYNYTAGDYTWLNPSSVPSGANSGYFRDSNNIIRVGQRTSEYAKQITIGSMLKFITPNNNEVWSKVVSVFEDGLGLEYTGTQAGQPSGIKSDGTGAITLDTVVPNGSTLQVVYPALQRVFTAKEASIIMVYLQDKRNFALNYDYVNQGWDAVTAPVAFDPDSNYDVNDSNRWMIYFEYDSSINSFNIHIRTQRIVIESNTINLGNINNEKELSSYTNKAKRDTITTMAVENNQIVMKNKFYVVGYDRNTDNVYDLSLVDGNQDSRPDNPDSLYNTVGNNNINITINNQEQSVNGLESQRVEWQHISADNQVVDPSFSNIIDVFVLESNYDKEFKNWLNGSVNNKPSVPTGYQLSKYFYNVAETKAMSDTVVYKPVRYKTIFGSTKAEEQLRASFRVIKVQNSNYTDSEVKTRCVEAIKKYFDSANWDFGETFYFTELAAFVHKELAGIITSFVIVPQSTDGVFGDLFQYTPNTDELLIPDISVNDIVIIENITDENIRIGQA